MINESAYSEQMSRPGSGIGSGLVYLLIGGGIGATLALLFAPKSGTELRNDIADFSRRGYDKAMDVGQQLKEQTTDIYGSVREKASQILNNASDKYSESGDMVSTAKSVVNDVSKTASGAVDEMNRGNNPGEQQRRQSNIM
jgi:gas vesicle protein